MNDTTVADATTGESASVPADPKSEVPADHAESAATGESSTPETGEKLESAAASPAEKEQPSKNGVQKRIDELTAKRFEAEKERDYYRNLVDQGNKPTEVSEPVKPTIEQFDYDSDLFANALDAYADQKAAWINQQAQAESQKRQQDLESQKKEWSFQSRLVEYAKANPEINLAFQDPNLQISEDMAKVIKETDKGLEVAHYLYKNPNLAATISSLPTHMQYMEMGKIEHEINARKPPEVQLSNAPAPVTPVGAASSVTKDLSEMSYEEYVKARQKQIAARRS